MKKLLFLIAVLLAAPCASQAESDGKFYGLGNRLGVGVGVGTEGVGFNVSTCLTKYVGVNFGVNVMPGFNFKTDVDVSENVSYGSNVYPYEGEMEAEASLSRTMVDLKFDFYPFPDASSFFIAAGFSFGGDKILKISGHSDEFADLAAGKDYAVNIGEFRLPIDEHGNVSGGVKVNAFRPYFGLGFGRLVPKKRVGFRFELGLQIHGKLKVYADGVGDLTEELKEEAGDDISEIMDKLTVYPVLKFALTGRIL